jgi:uncharacterized protein YodC (DUF2158 family)
MNVGEVVRLRSGGQEMTVSGIERCDGLVTCYWFDGAELKDEAFDPEMLELVDDETGFYDADDCYEEHEIVEYNDLTDEEKAELAHVMLYGGLGGALTPGGPHDVD